jgi:peptide/nickel transport system permease protein
MKNTNFNEELKKKEQENRLLDEKKEITLDSTERIKVLSPGRLVLNRFMRNKLAIVGSLILIFMFLFAFIAPLFYPYSQTEIFYKYDKVRVDYAQSSERTDYVLYMVGDNNEIAVEVSTNINSTIKKMEEDSILEEILLDDNGNQYIVKKEAENIYALYADVQADICRVTDSTLFAEYNGILSKLDYKTSEIYEDTFLDAIDKAIANGNNTFTYQNMQFEVEEGRKQNYTIYKNEIAISYDEDVLGEEFEAVLYRNLEKESFIYEENEYSISYANRTYLVRQKQEKTKVAYMSTYVLDAYQDNMILTENFKINAITAVITGEEFEMDGNVYILKQDENEIFVYQKTTDELVAEFSTIAVRAYDGTDSLSIDYKDKMREMIVEMEANTETKAEFVWSIPQFDENGKYVYDENGDAITEVTTMYITRKSSTYVVSCDRVSYLIDIYASPSSSHLIGTDGNGMDVLSRMMYGGRISLLVCFVVIIIENILGIFFGGIAGFFGGWIDNIIMRMVDIFYCIPSLPILIIVGALFDQLKLDPYIRMIWLMVILGVLGWAGVARLVRGQILSLREQEFMVAAEAIGIKTKRRIFKHLVPNVMPQIIVTASSGLGAIIITESTLSFLGLGVKHPLATWGTMINSVTASSETMIAYTYIWVPVGLLICLTVIAFNFVGDGLRDAFDPKMKQ